MTNRHLPTVQNGQSEENQVETKTHTTSHSEPYFDEKKLNSKLIVGRQDRSKGRRGEKTDHGEVCCGLFSRVGGGVVRKRILSREHWVLVERKEREQAEAKDVRLIWWGA